MLFSRSTEYAIRAMTTLASQKPGKLTGAREISNRQAIPMPFLWKILQILTRRRLVRSFKGMHGGYELARPADRISLHSIVQATDGDDFRERCVLGLPECVSQNPCPLHEQWRDIRAGMNKMMDETSLADLARVARSRRAGKK